MDTFSTAPIIGFTGKRNVGKSTAAALLEEEFGFERIHPVGALKEAWRQYLSVVTGSVHIAERMVYGDLKDVPSEFLPNKSTPRFYFEKAGKFQADLGVEWTLGLEFQIARREFPRAPLVVESIVYEAPWLRSQGGKVVRLLRPGFDGPEGVETDAAQADIEVDFTISATTVEELQSGVRGLIRQIT
ncbi:hypothetical protein [Aquamicrobium terrae]